MAHHPTHECRNGAVNDDPTLREELWRWDRQGLPGVRVHGSLCCRPYDKELTHDVQHGPAVLPRKRATSPPLTQGRATCSIYLGFWIDTSGVPPSPVGPLARSSADHPRWAAPRPPCSAPAAASEPSNASRKALSQKVQALSMYAKQGNPDSALTVGVMWWARHKVCGQTGKAFGQKRTMVLSHVGGGSVSGVKRLFTAYLCPLNSFDLCFRQCLPRRARRAR
jgi:hypothetical protein